MTIVHQKQNRVVYYCGMASFLLSKLPPAPTLLLRNTWCGGRSLQEFLSSSDSASLRMIDFDSMRVFFWLWDKGFRNELSAVLMVLCMTVFFARTLVPAAHSYFVHGLLYLLVLRCERFCACNVL